jgi:hypothetical protein
MLLALTTSFAAACGTAESGEAEGGSRVEEAAIPAGTTMVFALDESVSTNTHGRGDEFTATLQADVADSRGETILPQGALSRWIVTQSVESDGGESTLAVELDAVRVDGEWVPLVGEVVAADVRVDPRDSDGRTAAKIGIGTAAGAVLGRVIGGDAGSTVAGAAVGAVAGTAVALSDRDGSATLPEGSTVTLRLTQPLATS